MIGGCPYVEERSLHIRPERRIGTTVNRNRMEREGALERAARPNLHVGRLAYCKAPTYAITSLIEVACPIV